MNDAHKHPKFMSLEEIAERIDALANEGTSAMSIWEAREIARRLRRLANEQALNDG